MSRKILSIITPPGFRALLSSSSEQSRVIPLDATWYMPNVPEEGKKQFLEEDRISNAAFFDLDKICLPESKYPHMLPPFGLFNESLAQLGIRETDKVIVYDKSGIFSSPRVAWMMALYGHRQVYLLDNYNTYRDFSYPIDTNKVNSLATNSKEEDQYMSISETEFSDAYSKEVVTFEELLNLVESGKLQEDYFTFDARSADRFTGKAPEPRPELSSGHIPSSLSLPFTKVLNSENNTFKSRGELIRLFKDEFGLDLSTPDLQDKKGIIVMCGSGVTAVILKLAIEGIIKADVPVRVYDGSWTEWAQRAPNKFIIKDY